MVWAAGQRLQKGKYIIEKILGEGGFGITYQARHTLLQQLVVIKTPNESLKNDPEYPKYLQRFVEEGRRLEKLSEKQHPNIVRVRDLFEKKGIYCLVMDFVAGESLFDLVRRRGALPANEAVEYVRQIGEALTVVHQASLVHRDAHPGNIMVQSDGKAVLIDFGIAGEILQTVESSKHFGNWAFAPYEQMMGSREPTVDVYCLAASLYYAVTGQCPTSSLDRKLNNVRLIKPKQHADISDELNRAILKGMELEAKNRPQSMQEWLKLLEVANRTVPVGINKVITQPTLQKIHIDWGLLVQRFIVCVGLGFLLTIPFYFSPLPWFVALAGTSLLAYHGERGVTYGGLTDIEIGGVLTMALAITLTVVPIFGTKAIVSLFFMGIFYGFLLLFFSIGPTEGLGLWYLMLIILTPLTMYNSKMSWSQIYGNIYGNEERIRGLVAWCIGLTSNISLALRMWEGTEVIFWDIHANDLGKKPFSNFHKFLILSGTSWIGLGAGAVLRYWLQ
ncbi:serine/threonine protein kinase [Planktothrix sp. FACHB-1355]|uniref:Serine/threonine protein kinase n=1 Tax=Aerosakkonema funiforme FACHB-1375 TaxID=2949571 RepID=A0A926ZIE7_9CYAN|nr:MULTISPECIES: serine/threonine-protein kinase [Oscillatoriales]MBD2183624.1 serine/threonine protein kinase [Aerosakkonema funiforme FACHB-1375]MBD3558096.1 serine/threonine protein kinase [Planktothrix sp. FACHB-1355]